MVAGRAAFTEEGEREPAPAVWWLLMCGAARPTSFRALVAAALSALGEAIFAIDDKTALDTLFGMCCAVEAADALVNCPRPCLCSCSCASDFFFLSCSNASSPFNKARAASGLGLGMSLRRSDSAETLLLETGWPLKVGAGSAVSAFTRLCSADAGR